MGHGFLWGFGGDITIAPLSTSIGDDTDAAFVFGFDRVRVSSGANVAGRGFGSGML
jgi:hypothetical protein